MRIQLPAFRVLSGTPLEPNTPLALSPGDNLVSFLADIPLPVATGLSSIDGRYSSVLGYEGKAVSFYPGTIPNDESTGPDRKPAGAWRNQILEALFTGPKRYSDLSVCPIEKTRAKRLKELKSEGLIETTVREKAGRDFVHYKLTEKGEAAVRKAREF